MLRLLVSLLVASVLSVAVWYGLGRPVVIAEPAVAGRLNCLSYTPFRADESPFEFGPETRLQRERIEEDLQLLSRYTSCIRVYATVGMEIIPAVAQHYGMQVVLGAWVSADAAATRAEVEALVQVANAWPQTVRAVLVGNEALLRREIAPEALAALIHEVRQRVAQPAGYADVWEFHLRHPQVAAASEFITIHILPYWEDEPVAIDQAIAHVRATRQRVEQQFPHKPILIGETGWPSVGRMRAGALPDRVNEARFIRGFVAAAHAEGWDYNLIEAFDQPWKRRLEGAVGGYWGLFTTDRQDKGLLQGDISNHPHWLPLALLAAGLAVGMILVARPSVWLTPLVAFAAVGWTLQLEQLWLIVRSGSELAAGVALLALLLALSLAALSRLTGRPWPAPLEARLVMLIGGVAAVLSLWLMFDARYRDFHPAGFLPVAALLALAWRQTGPVLHRGREELVLGALLLCAALFITVHESLLNHQALAWSLAMVLLGVALVRRALQQPAAGLVQAMCNAVSLRLVVALAAGMGLAYAMRYGVLENAVQAEACQQPPGGWCNLRAALGWSLYHQVFGLAALGMALLAWLPRLHGLALSALLLAGFGVSIYNATYAAIAAVLALLVAVRRA